MNNLHISLTDFRNESRLLKQAKSIAKLDAVPLVFIVALHSPGLATEESIDDRIKVRRVVLKTRRLSKGIFSQILKYIELLFFIARYCRGRNIGVVNVHSLALLPIGLFLKCLIGAKLIYDAHELETETDGLTYARKKLGKLLERWVINYVDHIFVVSESISRWYADSYKIAAPTVITNAPISHDVIKSNILRDVFAFRPEQKIFLYQGLLDSGRGIEIALNAFIERVDDRAVLVFMGYGPLEAMIKTASKKSENVYFHEAVPPDQVLTYTASADFGVSFIENTCLSYFYSLPNKLFEYVMAGLPVLVSNMQEAAEFVKSNKVGCVVMDTSPLGVNAAIDDMLAGTNFNDESVFTRVASEVCWERQEPRLQAVFRDLLEVQ